MIISMLKYSNDSTKQWQFCHKVRSAVNKLQNLLIISINCLLTCENNIKYAPRTFKI